MPSSFATEAPAYTARARLASVPAMVLGGGEGRRLRPLTAHIAKIMMPVAGQPLVAWHLRTLADLGCDQVLINLHRGADCTARYLAAVRPPPEVVVRMEPELRGPAGSLLTFADFFVGTDTALVLSGDGLHDVDLEAFVEFHRRSGRLLSVVLKRVADPGRFGVAEVDHEGRITAFAEKPAVEVGASGLVSCGIYAVAPCLLDRFPRGVVYDFGADLIPNMVDRGEEVGGFVTASYWNDIGTPDALLQANLDVARGGGPRRARRSTAIGGVDPTASIHPSARIGDDVIVAAGSVVGREASIVGPAVLGLGCHVAAAAHVEAALLFDGARIPAGGVVVGGIHGPAPGTWAGVGRTSP